MTTPKKALILNCRFCHGGTRNVPKCESTICSFNRVDYPILDRIKEGCYECAANHKPEECTGRLIGTQAKMLSELLGVPENEAICPLWPYRMGNNPKMARKGTADRLRPFQFTPQSATSDKKGANLYVLRNRIRAMTFLAFKNGKIEKKPCRVCGNIESEMHHIDYSNPLDVIWLCRIHHRLEHKIIKLSS